MLGLSRFRNRGSFLLWFVSVIAWVDVWGRLGGLNERWTLKDLVDFEAMCGREGGRDVDEEVLRRAVRGLDGANARRVGMRVWLEEGRRGEADLPGDVWGSGRFLAGGLVMVVMFLTGVGVMTGMLDRERMGFRVPMVLGVAVGLQILVLVGAGLAWVLRGRFSKGLGFVPGLLGWLVGRMGGKTEWWKSLRLAGGRGWEAIGWNLVRLTQVGAMMFSVGLMGGLLGCIWFLEVGFFWESTTPEWMAARLHDVSGFLGAPWGWLFPGAVPSMAVIEGTRTTGGGAGFARVWYLFLFGAIFVWGFLPRFLLWIYAVFKERRALAGLDFQGKKHRALWRDMMGVRRADTSEAPMDGVLVLDVGGTGISQESLRGFLLRRMRVNPGGWYEVGVWDGKGEDAARESIRRAPAGVVLLAEGWALSPPRMKALLGQIRGIAGSETMVFFLVVNAGRDGVPMAVSEEEKGVWRDFVDGLADAAAEIYFYEE